MNYARGLLYFYGMKYTVFVLVTCLLIASCNNDTPPVTAKNTQTDSAAAPQSFFPVPDYIGGQLRIIDSLQLPLRMSVTVNNKTKSTVITGKELGIWAKKFQQPDISDPALKNYYKETNLADQSIPSVTLIYSAADNTLAVQKINVFIKPDPVENDKVTGIYIEKTFSRNDTGFNQKLYWKTGKSMQVVTEKQIHGKLLPAEQVKIVWDGTE
jgi:hypothetical protein